MSSNTGWGITEQGFVMPQLSDIQAEINQALVNAFGAAINLQPSSFFGQISGIFAEREALIWQAMQDDYNSQIPDEAFGASLDNLGALRGIPRLKALASTIQNVRLFGTAGTLIPGTTTQFSVQNAPTSIFALNSPVTLVAGQSCVQRISFSAVPASGTWQIAINGDETSLMDFSATASDVQTQIQALEFCSGCTITGNYASGFTVTFNGAGTGGFMVQPQFTVSEDALEDSGSNPITVTTSITTPGIDQASVSVTAIATGPTVANAGTLNVIVTPVSGLTAVLSTQDASIGQNVETDNAYRARMNEELQIAGAGTVEAIRSRLLQVSGVTSALVYENTTDITDLFNRPPHSFECIVSGGDPATIAETIWLAKPAGIATYGNTSQVITDSQGQTHTIYYSLPTAIPVYIIANLTVDGNYPSNGDATVQSTLVVYVNGLGEGGELIVNPKMMASIAGIPGIQTAVLLVGTSPSPSTSNNITPTAYQYLQADTSRTTVNS